MPIYTFICKDCGMEFEVLVNAGDKEAEISCKKCNSKNIQKILSTFSARSKNNSSSTPSCPTGTCNLG